MKKINILLFAAIAISGLSSCQEAAIETPAVKTEYEIVDGMAKVMLRTAPGTKTTMGADGSILWSEDDEIAVFVGENLYEFMIVDGIGTTSATFEGYVLPEDLEKGIDAAVYMDDLGGLRYEDGVIYYDDEPFDSYVPTWQYYCYTDSFDSWTLPMAGTVEGNTIIFRSTAAVLKLTLNNPDLGTLVEVDLYYGDENETWLDCECGLDATVTSEGLDLYFVVAPGSQEYRVTYYDEDWEEYELGTFYTSEPAQAGCRYILKPAEVDTELSPGGAISNDDVNDYGVL